MKVLVTGGNRGLGKSLTDFFQADSVSRSNGYDITCDYKKIAEISKDYDIFINNAFDGPPQETWANFAQTNLLMSVYDLWKESNKSGLIVNIGSVGAEHVVAPEPRFETYRVSKAALAHASKQCTLAYKNNLVPFKTTLITLDRLDTELSRSRTNWTGNGIDCADVCRYIQFINQIQENTCVAETTLYVNYEYDGQK